MAQIVKKITMVNGQVTGVTGGTVDSADLTAVVAAGIYGDATHYPVITLDAGGQVTGVTLEPASSGSGTVTSVGMTVPAGLAVAGSPITTSGTLALTWSGQIPTANGGTGVDTSLAANGTLLIGNGAGLTLAALTAGAGVTITNAAGAITIAATGGGGTVTSVSVGAGLSGGVITTTGTISMPNVGTAGTYGDATHYPIVTTDAQGRVTTVTTQAVPSSTPSMPVNNQTGTTYIIVAGDLGKLVTFNNATGVTVTQPDAGGSFPAGWWYEAQNRGTGTVTLTLSTSTIDGVGVTFAIRSNEGCVIASDGVNYFTQRGMTNGTVYATLNAPTFTGIPAGPTAAVNTNTTQLATTAFVLAQASGSLPLMDSTTGSPGVATKYTREDHYHPTDSTLLSKADNLLSLASATVARSNLGLGTLATQSGTFSGTSSGTNTGDQTTATTQAVLDNSTKFATTAFVQQATSPTPLSNGYLSCSVAGSALTVKILTNAAANPSSGDPVTVSFRDVTLGTGDQAVLTIAAATSLVISSGSTLGFASATAGRAWIVGINDAGTFRLGAINCRSGNNVFPLREDNRYTSTAEGGAGAADSSQVIYTGTAVAVGAIRILGYIEWSAGLTTAGTWDIVPTRVQPMMRGVSLPGELVQSALATLGTVATGTTTVPVDNTIPQNTEGDQYLSQAITPTSAANILDVDAQLFATNAAGLGGVMIASLYQDTTANAFATSWMNIASNGGAFYNHLETRLLAGTTSSTTIKLRCGCSASGTTTVNGTGGGQMFGGALNSYLGVREIMG